MKKYQTHSSIILFSIFFTLINIIFFSTNSLAAVLPYGSIITDNNGLTIGADGKYLIDIDNALPGESYEKEFIIRSAEKIEPYQLSLRVKKIESIGDINWNEHTKLTLSLDGKKIYQGKILGSDKRDWANEDLVIGTFKYGSEKKLMAKFDIDKDLTNEDFNEKNTLLYTWQFIATRNGVPIEEKDKSHYLFKLPQTGEEWREFIYKMITGMLLILLVILIWKHRRQENEQ